MHPALSVIFFTAVSGAGYGLAFLLGLIFVVDPTAITAGAAWTALACAALFAAAGLISSMLHLGHPERAWRAYSQWRSSWLSREGIAATACFVPLAALGVAIYVGADGSTLRSLGGALAAFAAVTVVCTAKIYTSLRTVPAWHNGYVLPAYLLLGLCNGAAWLLLLVWLAAPQSALVLQSPIAALILLLAVVSALWKVFYWRYIDVTPLAASAESATGLGRFGRVSSFETPHTQGNYLTHEMGFVLARKHAGRLRRFALILIGVVPFAIATLLLRDPIALPAGFAALCSVALVVSLSAGIFVERWLFFAEAKHVVMLYYGGHAETQRA